MFNLQDYRQIFEMNYINLYYHVLVASYDHRHKPEVAHHVEVPPGSALPLTPNDSQASLVVTINKVGVGLAP